VTGSAFENNKDGIISCGQEDTFILLVKLSKSRRMIGLKD